MGVARGASLASLELIDDLALQILLRPASGLGGGKHPRVDAVCLALQRPRPLAFDVIALGATTA
jgi:hypothetical protein